jgi:hypothetical protein
MPNCTLSSLHNCVNYYGNIVKSCCTSMNLNKYYGYVYVSADNVKSKYEIIKGI